MAKVNPEHILNRPLKSRPIAQHGAGAEANLIEQVLEKLQHLDTRKRNDVIGKPALKQTPRQIVLVLGRRPKSRKQRINDTGRVAGAQDLSEKSRAVQRAEMPDACQTIPAPVRWNGVVRRCRWARALWNRGGNHVSCGRHRTITTRVTGQARMRCSSRGIIAIGGKRYKDPKAAQSKLRQSTARAPGCGKTDTHLGRRWLTGDAIRSTSKGPAQRRTSSNAKVGSVHSVFSGSTRLRASATTLRAVGTLNTWRWRARTCRSCSRDTNSRRRSGCNTRPAWTGPSRCL